jgi:hypothetical protein
MLILISSIVFDNELTLNPLQLQLVIHRTA